MFDRLHNCIVRASATILEAMNAINRGAVEIAFVVDKRGAVIGTCTDGDVRRALLADADFDSPIHQHIQPHFVWVGAESGRAEVLDLMQAHHIHAIPILDADRRLIGLHLMRELIGAVNRPNWAVLMAGGKGTRLRPLTQNVPKPMLAVAGRPILERLVLHLIGFGVSRIFLSVGYMANVVEDFFGNGARHGCTIDYLREEDPLGTAGALSLLPATPEHPLILMNGDLITGVDVADMLDFHIRGRYVATVGTREHCYTVPYGTVTTDQCCIREISEKPTHSWLVNTGVYILNPEFVARIPKATECPITSFLDQALKRNERIGAFHVHEDWTDVGRVSDLARALGAGSVAETV
jgi:dTDP-glucose pyrophosphorylase